MFYDMDWLKPRHARELLSVYLSLNVTEGMLFTTGEKFVEIFMLDDDGFKKYYKGLKKWDKCISDIVQDYQKLNNIST